LVKKSKLALFGAREALITRGQEGHSMFILLEGGVEIVGRTDKGARVTLSRMGPGECFGERSLLTGEPRNATVRAEEDTLVVEICKQDLSPLIESNPDLAERLGELLAERERKRAEALSPEAFKESESSSTHAQSPRSFAARIRSFFKA